MVAAQRRLHPGHQGAKTHQGMPAAGLAEQLVEQQGRDDGEAGHGAEISGPGIPGSSSHIPEATSRATSVNSTRAPAPSPVKPPRRVAMARRHRANTPPATSSQ